MRSLIIAIAMYSKLPVPLVEWDKRSLSWALCFFPVVGVVIGLAEAAAWYLTALLRFSPLLQGAVLLALPILISGAIHLDGFCDTCDALSSHQSRERKLEILKDSHTGAFAIICCCVYLIFFFALWGEASLTPASLWCAFLMPVLSRGLSGLFAVTLPNARGTGLLATFTGPMDAKKARGVMVLWVAVACAALLVMGRWTGLWVMVGAAAACGYYVHMSRSQFGGITGDLAGFFVQVCECAMVLALVLCQKVGALL